MVQSLARCRECGLPGKLADGLEWGSGGIIALRRAKSLRLALIDEAMVKDISVALGGAVGADALQAAEVEATRDAVAVLLHGLRGRLSRYTAVKKRMLEALEEYSLLLGMGRIELEKFALGEGGAFLLRRPFELGIMVAGITGALEEMEQCMYGNTLDEIGANTFRLVLEAAGARERERNRERITFRNVRTVPGGKDMRTCGKCGLPLSVAGLLWDEMYGMIQAGPGGRRLCLLPAFILASMDRLGTSHGVHGIVEETVFGSVKRRLEEGAEDNYESADVLPSAGESEAVLDRMNMRGWGAVIASRMEGDSWRLEVLNPIDDALIAGWLRAIYTVAMGREPSLVKAGEPYNRVYELT